MGEDAHAAQAGAGSAVWVCRGGGRDRGRVRGGEGRRGRAELAPGHGLGTDHVGTGVVGADAAVLVWRRSLLDARTAVAAVNQARAGGE
ncbi:hypothetical protein [Actinomadura miaoliensis]|uniref:Uncharacterized protein n=1 Tax=Actinomadura miaoliensis TaxID=430685 RepID=A0ABP7V7Z8_9ACTN